MFMKHPALHLPCFDIRETWILKFWSTQIIQLLFIKKNKTLKQLALHYNIEYEKCIFILCLVKDYI